MKNEMKTFGDFNNNKNGNVSYNRFNESRGNLVKLDGNSMQDCANRVLKNFTIGLDNLIKTDKFLKGLKLMHDKTVYVHNGRVELNSYGQLKTPPFSYLGDGALYIRFDLTFMIDDDNTTSNNAELIISISDNDDSSSGDGNILYYTPNGHDYTYDFETNEFDVM